MTYTITTTFTFNQGQSVTTAGEWETMVSAYYPQALRDNLAGDRAANSDWISSSYQYNDDHVIRDVVMTDKAAWDALRAGAYASQITDVISNMEDDGIVRSYNYS